MANPPEWDALLAVLVYFAVSIPVGVLAIVMVVRHGSRKRGRIG